MHTLLPHSLENTLSLGTSNPTYHYSFSDDPRRTAIHTESQMQGYIDKAQHQKVAYTIYYTGSSTFHYNAAPYVYSRETGNLLYKIAPKEPTVVDFKDKSDYALTLIHQKAHQKIQDIENGYIHDFLREYNQIHQSLETQLSKAQKDLLNANRAYNAKKEDIQSAYTYETIKTPKAKDEFAIQAINDKIEKKTLDIREAQAIYKTSEGSPSQKNIELIRIQDLQSDLATLKQKLHDLENPGYDETTEKTEKSWSETIWAGVDMAATSLTIEGLRQKISGLKAEIEEHTHHHEDIQKPYCSITREVLDLSDIHVQFSPSKNPKLFLDQVADDIKTAFRHETYLWQALTVLASIAVIISVITLANYASTWAIISLLDPSTLQSLVWIASGLSILGDMVVTYLYCSHLSEVEHIKLDKEALKHADKAYDDFKQTFHPEASAPHIAA